ncbi:hypothetical protein BDC45DRAFT_524106 [Circinella umbellata]|nr:hypothetical protein BDC45DRAFT_524106 [Circinella umbellata]
MSDMYSKQYSFTNIAELMLSNPMGRPEQHPLYVDALTGESITLFRFRQLVGLLHAGLKRFGLKQGDSICFYSPNNIYMGPFYAGVMSAGMAISPANTAYVLEEFEHQLQISEAKMLIAHPNNLETALKAADNVGLPRSSIFSIIPDSQNRVPLWSDVLIDYNEPPLPPVKMTHEESVNTVAYLCFSSGTTGKSKGVMTSHYNCIAMVMETHNYSGIFNDPSVQKIVLAVIPLFHFSGIHRVFNMGIPQGNTHILMEKYTVSQMCEAIQRFKVTDFPTAPPIIIHLVNNPIVDKYDLSSLRALTVGSAPIATDIMIRFQKKYKHTVLFNSYGMTEASPVITYNKPEWAIPGSIGRMIPAMRSKLVDLDGNEVTEVNKPGELWVQGPNIMLGYKGNPEATAGAITKDNWLLTGDVVTKDENGNLYIVDRIKELIKYKGFQVAPVELESVLLQCSYVADAGVVGIYDDVQGTEIPLAYVVLRQEYQSHADTVCPKIQAWVNERVANHKRLRGGVRAIDAIPKNPSGKILRRKMKEIYKYQEQQASPGVKHISKL